MKKLSKELTAENIEFMIQLDPQLTIEHFNSLTDFTISSKDGSILKNDSFGLSCLIECIYEENNYVEITSQDEREEEDEDDETPIKKIDSIAVLEHNNYEVFCESPLEISLKHDESSLATMFFALLIEQTLCYPKN